MSPGGRQHLIPHDHLHHTGGVAQIDKRDAAVVSPPGDPSGQRDLGSSLLGAQPAGIVGADQRASISTSTNLTSYGPTTFWPPELRRAQDEHQVLLRPRRSAAPDHGS